MKRFLVAGFLACSAPAIADTSACDAFSELARQIMNSRQSGVPMKSSMALVEQSDDGPEFKEFMRGLVIAAYEVPAYSTEQMKKKAVTDFEDNFYLSCTKAQL